MTFIPRDGVYRLGTKWFVYCQRQTLGPFKDRNEAEAVLIQEHKKAAKEPKRPHRLH